MAKFMTILLMLLLFELEITVLDYTKFSPLVILIRDYFSLVTNISVSGFSTEFSGLPQVTDPQPQDGMHVILFYLHLNLLVVQVFIHVNPS